MLVRELSWPRGGIDGSHECNDEIQIGVVLAQRVKIDSARVVDVLDEDFRSDGLPLADAP